MSHLEQFYVDPADVRDDSFVIRGDEFKHAVRILRKTMGDELMAVDGRGNRYSGSICRIGDDSARISIKKVERNAGEPNVTLTLAQALLKHQIFDVVVEKCTEIGVACFQPIVTERMIVPGSQDRVNRWRKKALAAMKQCGRSMWPEVHAPVSFAEAIKKFHGDMAIIAHASTNARRPFSKGVIDKKRNIVLFIGPEGGFSDSEYDVAIANGMVTIDLGVRRLRSETAAIVASSIILHTAGELGGDL
jgi:16S rRNA (uracil1498-N3)-methyltransferase